MTGSYRFRCQWWLPLPPEVLLDVLADPEGYPRWWPQIRAATRVDADTVRMVVRSVLPYRLDLVLVRLVEDRTGGVLEARLHGALEGWSRWTVRAAGPGSSVRYEQEVTVCGRLLTVASAVARPLLVANHDAMMRGARRGLLRLARTTEGGAKR